MSPHQRASKLLAVGIYSATILLVCNLIEIIPLAEAFLQQGWNGLAVRLKFLIDDPSDVFLFLELPALIAIGYFVAAIYLQVPPLHRSSQRRLLLLTMILGLIVTPPCLLLMNLMLGFVPIRSGLDAAIFGYLVSSIPIGYSTSRWFTTIVRRGWLEVRFSPR